MKRGKWLIIVALPLILFGGCQALMLGGHVFRYLLPFTLPSKVQFVEETTNSPLKDIRVRFTWYGSRGTAGGSGGEWIYYTKEIVTDENGSVWLPVRLKPFPVLLLPLYLSGHDAIKISIASWKLKPQKYLKHYDPYSQIVSIFGTEMNPVIKVNWLSNPNEQLTELAQNARVFGKEFWQIGLKDIISNTALDTISLKILTGSAEACSKYGWEPCDDLDREILRRNDEKGDTEWAESAALRLGIVTPAMRATAQFLSEEDLTTNHENGRIAAIRATDPQQEQELLHRFRTLSYSKLSASELHNVGIIAFNNSNYDLAIALWLMELEKDVNNANTMNNIGIGFAEAKKYKKAEYWARKSLKRNANFGHAYVSRGIALIGLSRYREAEEIIRKGIGLGFENGAAHMSLGFAYHMEGKKLEAEQEFKLVEEKYPNFPRLKELLKEYGYYK